MRDTPNQYQQTTWQTQKKLIQEPKTDAEKDLYVRARSAVLLSQASWYEKLPRLYIHSYQWKKILYNQLTSERATFFVQITSLAVPLVTML